VKMRDTKSRSWSRKVLKRLLELGRNKRFVICKVGWMLGNGSECINRRCGLNAMIGIYTLKRRRWGWIIDLVLLLLRRRLHVDDTGRCIFCRYGRALEGMCDGEGVMLRGFLLFVVCQQLRAGAASKASVLVFRGAGVFFLVFLAPHRKRSA